MRIVAPGGLAVGSRGRLRVVKVQHAGYEVLEELVSVAVLEGDPDPLDPSVAGELLTAGLEDAPGFHARVADEELEDAVEEVLFVQSERLSIREQERFGQAVSQIETSIEDQVLLLERRRVEALLRVDEAERSRDAALGADARTKAEQRLGRRQEALEALEVELERLRRREDESYARWMERAHERRSRPPQAETMLDVHFELVGADE